MKTVAVLLAEGFEEIEAVTPIDFLRRAGIEVKALGLGGMAIKGAHGIVVQADAVLDEAAMAMAWDAVVVPGGMPGAAHIAGSALAVSLIRRQFHSGGAVAAICAAPAVVLHKACGILAGRRFTGYPGTEADVQGAHFLPQRVVVDGNLITSRGPGTAGEFAVALIASLAGEAASATVASRALLRS